MRCTTTYTDASVCHASKTGGWSCWIKAGPGETALYSGAFKTECANSTEAELMAIANAIHAAKKAFPHPKTFVVVTDCQAAIDYIAWARTRESHKPAFKVKALKPKYFALAKLILIAVPEGIELRVNKVKAHSNEDGKRSFVNNLVDVGSRRAMRVARAQKVSSK